MCIHGEGSRRKEIGFLESSSPAAQPFKSELYSFGSKKFSSASAYDNEISPNYVKVEDTAATLT